MSRQSAEAGLRGCMSVSAHHNHLVPLALLLQLRRLGDLSAGGAALLKGERERSGWSGGRERWMQR